MRRAVTVQMGLTLLIAFILAPFQHVHNDAVPGHAESGEIHAHFFGHERGHPHHPAGEGPGIGADDDDDHAHAQAVDGYTIERPGQITPALPAPATFVPLPLISLPIAAERVEARANSPPSVQPFAPRPPPR